MRKTLRKKISDLKKKMRKKPLQLKKECLMISVCLFCKKKKKIPQYKEEKFEFDIICSRIILKY